MVQFNDILNTFLKVIDEYLHKFYMYHLGCITHNFLLLNYISSNSHL